MDEVGLQCLVLQMWLCAMGEAPLKNGKSETPVEVPSGPVSPLDSYLGCYWLLLYTQPELQVYQSAR